MREVSGTVSDSTHWQAPDAPYGEEALAATTEVVCESGRWVVYLDVLLASGGVRRRVGEYHDQRRADHAASIILRNAIRAIRRPPQFDALGNPINR